MAGGKDNHLSTSLVVPVESALTPVLVTQEQTQIAIPRPFNLDDTLRLGQALAASGYFQDARDANQAFAKIVAGQELGIGPMAAMTGIYIVKGRVTMSATLLAAQIKRSGRYNFKVMRLDDEACEITFFEGGQPSGDSKFTIQDAQKAGLLGNDTYKKFPRNMLYARAMSNGAKWYCPDMFSSPVYTPFDFNLPVDDAGEVVDVTPVDERAVGTGSKRATLRALPAAQADGGGGAGQDASLQEIEARVPIETAEQQAAREERKQLSKLRQKINAHLAELELNEDLSRRLLRAVSGGHNPNEFNSEQLAVFVEGLLKVRSNAQVWKQINQHEHEQRKAEAEARGEEFTEPVPEGPEPAVTLPDDLPF